jgi:ABC-type multidrug transport system fused ATPase/permease subunit
VSPTRRRDPALSLLWSSLRGHGAQWRRLAAWSTLQAFPAFLSGRLVAEAVDNGFLAGRTTTGLAWLAALAASVVLGAWAMRQTYLCVAALVEPLRDDLVTLTVKGSLRRSTAVGASADTAGVARLTQQVEIVRQAYAAVLNGVVGFVVMSISALLGLATLLPAVLVLVVPPVAIGLALFLCALGRLAARQRASILAGERIAQTSTTLAGGLREVMACGAEEQAHATVGEHIDAQARATRDVARFTAVRILAVAIGGMLPLILIIAAGPWLMGQGVTPGVVLGAMTYVIQGVQPALLTLVRELGATGLWLVVALRRIVEAADVPEPAAEAAAASGPEWPLPQRHGVRLRGVSFAYGPFAEPVIRDLDLVVPEGDHLAVVGPSGVGKSTLAGLITGVLEPQAGDVRIGAVPVRRFDPRTLARHRVLIPQEAYVFGGTLRENLTYLTDEATPAELERAVGELGMRTLVARLGGYDAEIDPSTLSAGERQLITLARAFLSPARLVVLDEATCHLDPAAEAQVEHAFARREGTLIVIAHRISSALRANRILVLDGTNALLGTHDDLPEQSALYRDLVGYWHSGAVPVALD